MDCQAIGDQPLSVTWSFNAQTLSTAGMTRYVTVVLFVICKSLGQKLLPLTWCVTVALL